MPTYILSKGRPHSITQNTEYALPQGTNFVLANAAVEVSLDKTNWSALTAANTTGVNTSAPFLRCPGGAAIVSIK